MFPCLQKLTHNKNYCVFALCRAFLFTNIKQTSNIVRRSKMLLGKLILECNTSEGCDSQTPCPCSLFCSLTKKSKKAYPAAINKWAEIIVWDEKQREKSCGARSGAEIKREYLRLLVICHLVPHVDRCNDIYLAKANTLMVSQSNAISLCWHS